MKKTHLEMLAEEMGVNVSEEAEIPQEDADEVIVYGEGTTTE